VHLIACFKTPEDANIVIREGIVIAGKRAWARCMWREPTRCLKCQSLMARNLAASCNHQVACSTCGKENHTTECTETTSGNFWCVTCKLVGHASWDRLCPAFLEVCKQLDATDTEHTYKYFPGQDAWTWEQEATGWDVNMWGGYKTCGQYNFKDKDEGWAIRHDQMHINDGYTGGAAKRPPIQHMWDSRSETGAGLEERTTEV